MLTMRARRFRNKTRNKISANGSETIGFNKSKIECYNCHKRSHITREYRDLREHRNREPVRRNVIVETTEIKTLVAQDGLSSSSSDSKSQLNVGAYKVGLESVEAKLDVYKKNEVAFEEDIKILKLDIMLRDNALTELRKKFEKAEKERDDLKLTLNKFENSFKNLSKLSEGLDQTYDRLQKLISQLEILGETISQEDMNMMFLRSLPSEWKTHTLIWRNKPDLDTLSMDDLYNNLKIYETEVKGSSNSNQNSQNVAFVSYNNSDSSNQAHGSNSVNTDIVTSKVKTSESKPKSVSEPLIEDWISDSEDENETEFKSKQRKPSFAKVEFVKSNEHVKIPRESVEKFNHLIKDCDFYKKKMVEKPVWNNASRVNHQNSQRLTHPHPKGNFVPKAVLMKSGHKTLNTARQNSSKAAVSVNTARPINTAYLRRQQRNVTTVGPKAVVSDNKGNEANAVKASACWVWRPKQKVLDHGNPQLELQEKGVIDSGCSRHMTGNKSYLSDYEEIDGGFVAFGGDRKRGKITDKGKINTGKLDFEDVYFVKELNQMMADSELTWIEILKINDPAVKTSATGIFLASI
ncbi:hypothetical protein Tco_0491770 [Tanacetum coccineum]